ncbi:MAG: DNA mismatch repair protein MutS [Clostridia bacterium]|nr:DNA mismatch repair protein MutS [Clostridia bacterium]
MIIEREKLSPMMRHYMDLKDQIDGALLFYRLGDFYEMFFDDAILCSKLLDLTLTGRDCGLEERAPMCGVPYHAVDAYISKLLEKGYKVAICEQLSTEKKKGEDMVERAVVKIATPGTTIEDESLKADKNNYLCCVCVEKNAVGLCWTDISTGLMEAVEFSGEDMMQNLDDTLARIRPSEIISNALACQQSKNLSSVKSGMCPAFYMYKDSEFALSHCEKLVKDQFGVRALDVLDMQDKKLATKACGALLEYISETHMKKVGNIKKVHIVKDERYVHLDINARRNLELVEGLNTRKRQGSLLSILDRTKTAMGAREIRKAIEQPLRDETEINLRLDGVEELTKNIMLMDSLSEVLSQMQDIERKGSKIAAGIITPQECIMLANTLKQVASLKKLISDCKSEILVDSNMKMSDLAEVYNLIFDAIDDNSQKSDVDGFIKRGFDKNLDEARYASEYGKQWLAELEINERERTGIKNLKTGYNKVFGYYIEISKSWLNQIPDNYIRKQTMTTGERFITPELKEMEYKILNSKAESEKIEAVIYDGIKQTIASFLSEILDISHAIATIDMLLSFASVSNKYRYNKPTVSANIDHIKIVDGRHPVVEALSDIDFSPNDTYLDEKDDRLMLITGPNMAGKSTYMRQVAIITLMAHMGCFVPAKEAEISIIDRVFTRVGASDDLAFGRSTFMVEMSEVSSILANATDKSLIILDEVGRGTSTYDGLSIAWAIMEYLSKHLHAKTLFSTHYHELTELEGSLEGIKNYRVMVKEFQDNVIFMHKIARGSANKSFGIEVAKLAGLPDELVKRAKEILKTQEEANRAAAIDSGNFENVDDYCPNGSEVINILREMDMDTISPIMAFGTLQNLVDKVKNK